MIYDYGGFPDHTYHVHYDAPGDPELAPRVKSLIEAAGLPARLDAERGFDHGAFSPMKVIYPKPTCRGAVVAAAGLDPASTSRWAAHSRRCATKTC